jgi:cob(I)alamin adenosyltransferase
MIKKDFIKKMILEKPEKLELVMTGRGFPNEIITLADYANDIKSIAHPYNKGIKARKGIEY